MENSKKNTAINLMTLAKFHKDKGNLLKERELLIKAKEFADTKKLHDKIISMLSKNTIALKNKKDSAEDIQIAQEINSKYKGALWCRYPIENRYKATIEIEFDFKSQTISLDKSPGRILKQLKPTDFLVLALKNRMIVNKVVSVKRLKDKRYLGENYNQLKI